MRFRHERKHKLASGSLYALRAKLSAVLKTVNGNYQVHTSTLTHFLTGLCMKKQTDAAGGTNFSPARSAIWSRHRAREPALSQNMRPVIYTDKTIM